MQELPLVGSRVLSEQRLEEEAPSSGDSKSLGAEGELIGFFEEQKDLCGWS